ncbi:MAG: pilus assembly protein N-terminal domain-containing protein [Rhizobiales bacterium]|nr:pilus assembly protein N-terminal domain-containing protein [Hyphomicrobiales bacterium]
MSQHRIDNLKQLFFKLTLSITLLFTFTYAANAQTLRVEINRASILKLTETPSTIIIGNPAIADVTPQPNGILVLVGKASGRTNIIMLDDEGNVMHNYDLAVQEEQTDNLTMFNGGKQSSYNCSPYCENIVNSNDDQEVFTKTMGAAMARSMQITTSVKEAAANVDSDNYGVLLGAVAKAAKADAGAGTEATLQTFTILPPEK